MRSKSKELMQGIREYIDRYALENMGETPSTREIGERFGINNSTAFRYLKNMSELGMLVYENGEIHTEITDKIAPDIRIVGALDFSVAAGSPDMVDDVNVEAYFPVPSAFLHGSIGKFYMIQVNGDSMVDAGIDDDDYVIFRESSEPQEDDIVIAYIEGSGNTMKRYRKDNIGAYLWAENEGWTDKQRMFGRRFIVRGIVVKVMKDI